MIRTNIRVRTAMSWDFTEIKEVMNEANFQLQQASICKVIESKRGVVTCVILKSI